MKINFEYIVIYIIMGILMLTMISALIFGGLILVNQTQKDNICQEQLKDVADVYAGYISGSILFGDSYYNCCYNEVSEEDNQYTIKEKCEARKE